jgi:hypothetical protein
VNDSVEHRRQRLAETIAWCNFQKLINKPIESQEIKQRRSLGERAANHAFAAHQLESASVFKWVNRGKVKAMMAEASQMLAEARLDEIRPLASQLRTPELKPSLQLYRATSEAERSGVIEMVGEARASRLLKGAAYPAPLSVEFTGGKILRCTARGEIADRSPGYESRGFFDNDCAPPWDTWVCWRDGCLVAYVPRVLCGLAQRGMETDLLECIRWADAESVSSTFGFEIMSPS